MAGDSSTNCSMNLRLLINKKTGRVAYGEAGKDLVDLLLAFLLLPAGTIIRILQEHGRGSSESVGSMSNLYNSVDNLDASYMKIDKAHLLKPHPESLAFNGLPLLQYSTTPPDYYACDNVGSGYRAHQISTQSGQKCSCGHEMKSQVQLLNHLLTSSSSSSANSGRLGGYVKEAITYIITDDLNILPISTITSITELNRVQVKDISEVQEKTVTVGSDEVLRLLRASLASKTVLNDVFSQEPPSASQEDM